jgi:AcrR family transcriptional regulator
MGQFKKQEVRQAILVSAADLFANKGYTATTLAEIARGAGVSTAGVYVYYQSKLEILYAVHAPWLRARMVALEAQVAAISEPRAKLQLLLTTVWNDLPAEKESLLICIMQAISTATPRDRYSSSLLRWLQGIIHRMLADALPPERLQALGEARIAHLLVMAWDGFIMYRQHHRRTRVDKVMINAVCTMLLGE